MDATYVTKARAMEILGLTPGRFNRLVDDKLLRVIAVQNGKRRISLIAVADIERVQRLAEAGQLKVFPRYMRPHIEEILKKLKSTDRLTRADARKLARKIYESSKQRGRSG